MNWLIQDSLMKPMWHDLVCYLAQHSNSQTYQFIGLSVDDNKAILTGDFDIITEPPSFVRCGVKLIDTVFTAHDASDFILPAFLEKSSFDWLSALKQSIYFDAERLDQQFYSKLGLPLLNSAGMIIETKELLGMSFEQDMFVKPTSDLKQYSAGVLPAGNVVEPWLLAKRHRTNYMEGFSLVAPAKQIDEEYRCIVVDGRVVAISQYAMNSTLCVNGVVSSTVKQIAQEFAKLYQPVIAFTMDICRQGYEYFIVEYNCVNCSGWYACDIDAIVNGLSSLRG